MQRQPERSCDVVEVVLRDMQEAVSERFALPLTLLAAPFST